MSLRDQILSARDLPHEVAIVPEWGNAVVHIRTMNGRERSEFEEFIKVEGRLILDIMFKLVAICLRDPDSDERLFPGDGEELAEKNLVVVERLYDTAAALNKIGLTEVESEVGKSTGALGDDSASA